MEEVTAIGCDFDHAFDQGRGLCVSLIPSLMCLTPIGAGSIDGVFTTPHHGLDQELAGQIATDRRDEETSRGEGQKCPPWRFHYFWSFRFFPFTR